MTVIHKDFLENYFVRQVYNRAVSTDYYSGMDEATSWYALLAPP
jgi:hypothetical protein